MYNRTGDKMSIPILYLDPAILVCVKPRGVSSEAGGLPERLAAEAGVGKLWCVHRLDTAVGGVMVYARGAPAAASLSRQIAERSAQKDYLAVVSGEPPESEGVLKDLLFHDRSRNKSYVVRRPRAGVREAELDYRVLERAEGRALLAVRLHTGRSHQIRVQFASRGLPLLGDVKYGSTERGCPIALWSHTLAFSHPSDGRALHFSALPEHVFPWDTFEFMKQERIACDTSK